MGGKQPFKTRLIPDLHARKGALRLYINVTFSVFYAVMIARRQTRSPVEPLFFSADMEISILCVV